LHCRASARVDLPPFLSPFCASGISSRLPLPSIRADCRSVASARLSAALHREVRRVFTSFEVRLYPSDSFFCLPVFSGVEDPCRGSPSSTWLNELDERMITRIDDEKMARKAKRQRKWCCTEAGNARCRL